MNRDIEETISILLMGYNGTAIEISNPVYLDEELIRVDINIRSTWFTAIASHLTDITSLTRFADDLNDISRLKFETKRFGDFDGAFELIYTPSIVGSVTLAGSITNDMLSTDRITFEIDSDVNQVGQSSDSIRKFISNIAKEV